MWRVMDGFTRHNRRGPRLRIQPLPPRGPQAMNEKQKPRRRWFQFHLRTAVLMMLAASGFIRLNWPSQVLLVPKSCGVGVAFGWPFEVTMLQGESRWLLCGGRSLIDSPVYGWTAYQVWLRLLADFAIAVLPSLCVALFSESLRRRELRKP